MKNARCDLFLFMAMNLQNAQIFTEYHTEHSNVVRSARDLHQGIKPKQNCIKSNYSLVYSFDMVQKSQIVTMRYSWFNPLLMVPCASKHVWMLSVIL
jgi:hypothetical protein